MSSFDTARTHRPGSFYNAPGHSAAQGARSPAGPSNTHTGLPPAGTAGAYCPLQGARRNASAVNPATGPRPAAPNTTRGGTIQPLPESGFAALSPAQQTQERLRVVKSMDRWLGHKVGWPVFWGSMSGTAIGGSVAGIATAVMAHGSVAAAGAALASAAFWPVGVAVAVAVVGIAVGVLVYRHRVKKLRANPQAQTAANNLHALRTALDAKEQRDGLTQDEVKLRGLTTRALQRFEMSGVKTVGAVALGVGTAAPVAVAVAATAFCLAAAGQGGGGGGGGGDCGGFGGGGGDIAPWPVYPMFWGVGEPVHVAPARRPAPATAEHYFNLDRGSAA